METSSHERVTGRPPGQWRFGQVLLDEALACLSVNGVAVDLDRSSYDVMLALLRHAGEVVTKDELLDAGWPGRVVSENSLAKAVSRLRRVLGDDAEAIRAVHGYGYRLAAAVQWQPAGPMAVQAPPEHLREGDPVPHRPGWILQQRLGRGGAGTTFLVRDQAGDTGVIKIATSETGLRGLKREVALSRYIQAVRPDLPDVAPVLGWNLAQPPFFLELPYFAHGDLGEWATAPEGLAMLGSEARIALCAQLCDAVAGLHEIGIVHKDLKPGNLYPQRDAKGDWRIVLADLGASDATSTPRFAELGITLAADSDLLSHGAGSMPYLAPEVIAGEVPTQRSDVFALGVLVYQLVIGDLRRPFAPGWEADITDTLLREDIALAAATNPERRGLSARGFGERLRQLDARRAQRDRERDAEQRHARAQRALERTRARRPWLVATAVALALGTAISGWMYTRALKASRVAQENAAIADAVNRFFNQDVLSAASPYAQAEREPLTVPEAIDLAAARVGERLRDQPVVEATVRMTIGQVYGEGMQIAQAIEQERRAVALFERHLGTADPRTQQARYRLATDLTDDSRFVEAKALIDGTDAVRRQQGQAEGETTLLSHRASCYWYIRREQYDAGQAACEGVIAQQLALDPDDHNALIKARANLAVLHSRAGRASQAEAQFMRIDESFATLGDNGSPTRLRFQFLHGMNLLTLGRLDDAERVLGTAHRGSVAALGADNPHTLEVQVGLARLHLQRGQPDKAVPLLQHAHAAYTRQLGHDNHFTLDAKRALDEAVCASRQATPTAGAEAARACGRPG